MYSIMNLNTIIYLALWYARPINASRKKRERNRAKKTRKKGTLLRKKKKKSAHLLSPFKEKTY